MISSLITWVNFLVRNLVNSVLLGELFYSIANVCVKVLLLYIILNSTVDRITTEKSHMLKELVHEMAQNVMINEDLQKKFMPQPLFEHLMDDLATFKDARYFTFVGGQHNMIDSLFYADITFLDTTKDDLQKQYKIVSDLWKECDLLAPNFGITNLQTSGHSYLAIIGGNAPDNQHAIKCIQFALDVQKMFKQKNLGESVEIRFGIASGEVQAINLSGKSNPKWDIIG